MDELEVFEAMIMNGAGLCQEMVLSCDPYRRLIAASMARQNIELMKRFLEIQERVKAVCEHLSRVDPNHVYLYGMYEKTRARGKMYIDFMEKVLHLFERAGAFD